MILNWPWKIYKNTEFITYHYIGEDKIKKVGDYVNTTEGKFTIKRIDIKNRQIWV